MKNEIATEAALHLLNGREFKHGDLLVTSGGMTLYGVHVAERRTPSVLTVRVPESEDQRALLNATLEVFGLHARFYDGPTGQLYGIENAPDTVFGTAGLDWLAVRL